MSRPLIAFAVLGALVLSMNANAASKSASDLASLCSESSTTAKERCLGYIQGYLDAFAANTKTAEQSEWARRAIRTRIGSKLETRFERDLDQEFCAYGAEAAQTIKVRLLNEPVNNEPATRLIESIAREEFPCQTT